MLGMNETRTKQTVFDQFGKWPIYAKIMIIVFPGFLMYMVVLLISWLQMRIDSEKGEERDLTDNLNGLQKLVKNKITLLHEKKYKKTKTCLSIYCTKITTWLTTAKNKDWTSTQSHTKCPEPTKHFAKTQTGH